MSLTDKRIEEILKEVEPHAVRLPLGWKLFARAIEAEATKPNPECPRCFNPIKGQAGVEPAKNGTTANPQEPVAWVEVVDRHEGPYNFHGKELLDSGKHNLYTTPKPCLGCQDWAKRWNKVMDEVDESRKPCPSCAEKQSAIDVWEGRYADLSAKCAELEDFCISQGNELAKLDEKVFDQDRLLKQQAEKISATLVALAGLPDGALDGGWTYAGMNKYTLGLEADRDALAITVQQMRNAMLYVMRATVLSRDAAPDSPIGRIYETANHAYELPDNAAEIIKRHDAAVLRKAAEHLEGYEYVFNAPPINYAEAHELRLMANELEKSCQP